MGARMYLPGLSPFWGLVSRVHYDTVRRVRSLAVPVWVAHGDNDFVIPGSMGRQVFAAALRQGDLLIVPKAGHNDVPQVGGWHLLGLARTRAGCAPARRYSRRSSRNEIGTLIDSATSYFHDSRWLDEIGLVRVGDVYGVSPNRRAMIDNRNM